MLEMEAWGPPCVCWGPLQQQSLHIARKCHGHCCDIMGNVYLRRFKDIQFHCDSDRSKTSLKKGSFRSHVETNIPSF